MAYNVLMSTVIAWKQSDPRWKDIILGYNHPVLSLNFNLGNYGCLISSVASMVATITGDTTWTPARMNQYLQANDGFDPGGGLMRWYRVPQLLPVADHGKVNSVPNGWLSVEKNWAVLEIGGGRHYVLAINPTQIMDPATGTIRPLGSYRYTSVRLYEATGGKGAGTITTSTTGGEPIMTADQETQAYRIVLGRDPEGPVPTGRTGLDFILGAAGEVAQQRAEAAAQIQTLRQEINQLKVVTPNLAGTELVNRVTRVAKRAGEIKNFATDSTTYPVKPGMVFHQYSTFLANGERQVRTEKSEAAGLWWGASESLFDPLPVSQLELDKAQKVHLEASVLYADLKKLMAKLRRTK